MPAQSPNIQIDKGILPDKFPQTGIFSILPNRCAACQKWPAHGLCAACYANYKSQPTRCVRCAIEIPATNLQTCGHCLTHPFEFDRAIAAVPYTPPWNHLIHQLKFHQGTHSAWVIAKLMHMVIVQKMQHNTHKSSAPDNTPDLILPIAAATNRIKERGYNQAWEIARHLAPLTKLPAHALTLIRLHEHKSQTHRKRSERFKALKNAFSITPSQQPFIQGKHIALVDDVMTTGATMQAAAQALKQAGASKISAWVFARTPDHRNQR